MRATTPVRSLIAGVVLLGLLSGGCAKDPPVSKAARQRAAVVKALAVGDFGLADAKLVNETSDPGHKDGGDAATVGEDVEVTRSYQVATSDPVTICGAIVETFTNEFFSFSHACETTFASGLLLKAARTCSNFNVRAQIQIYTVDDPPFTKGKVLVVLRAPYPTTDAAGTCSDASVAG